MHTHQRDPVLLQRIFESSIEGILVVDKQGGIIDANVSCERMFGYDYGALQGKELETLLPQKFKKEHKTHREKYAESPETRHMGLGLELWGLKKDGTEFPLDISLSPSEVNGKPVTIAFIKDASKRKNDLSLIEKANVVLAETNRRYSTLIGNLRGIVYRCQNDRDWTMEYISEGCKRVTGYSSNDFLEGKVHFSHITFEEDQKQVWEDTQRGLIAKKPFSLNFRIRDKEGKVKYLQELGQGVFDENGALVALEGFITDVTEQKKAEEELLKKEAKNKALLEAMPDMMFIQDFKGNYLDFYAPEPEMPFISKEDIIGRNMKDILPAKVNTAIAKAHKKVLKSGKAELVEYELIVNKEIRFFEGRAVPLNRHALLTIVREITETKRIEQELRESEIKMRAILEAIPDRMLILNKEGDYLALYEPNEPDYLLLPKQEVVGSNMKKLLPDAVHDRIKTAIEKAITEKEIQLVEYTLKRKNGLRHYETRLVYMSADKVLAMARDITERKSAEKKLAESESKNKAILKALPDIIIVNDRKGRILEMYTPDPTLLTASVADITGKHFHEVLPKNISEEVQKFIKRANRNGTIEYLETTFPTANGTVDFEVRIVPLENGQSLSILRDVTETKKAQNNLFIRDRALAAAGNGILIVDARLHDMPIIYTNDSFERITGYVQSEVIGKNCRFLQNDDREQVAIAEMAKQIQKGKPCQVILRNYKKDGTLFWNELTITPVHSDHGELTHFIGVQNDVTQRKNEELLKEDIRKILEQIANEYPLAMIAHTIVETVQRHLKGCKASILLLDQERHSLHKLAAPDLPDEFSKGVEGVIIGDKAGSCGTAAFLADEVLADDIATDPRWADYKELALKYGLRSCWSFPVFSSKKEVLGTFAIYGDHHRKPQKREREIVTNIIDLTSVAIEQHRINVQLNESKAQLEQYAKHLEEKVEERTDEIKATVKKLVETNLKLKDQVQETRAAEKKALASQAMFTAISKNFPKGVIIVYSPDFEIVYIDGGEIRRMGFEQHQFAGRRIDDVSVFSKQRIARIKEDVKKTMAGERLSFEIRFKNKDYAVNSSPLMGDGGQIKWSLFVYNDITKQKQAEADIRNALVREQELSELKSRFVSMASHEFRTPLSAISTSAILIGKQSDAGNFDKLKKYVEQIQQNVRNLVVILNDFLSLSKLEEGKVQAKSEYFDLVGFTKKLIGELEPNLKRGQRIVVKADPEVIGTYLDPRLIHHVLTNLVSNAIKYSEEGQHIEMDVQTKESSILVLVRDHGIGIPEEEQANLFQRFFRAENSTNIQGTGLGLHIVKQYTELMGGQVGFESEKDLGSTFWVEFPVTHGGV